jgi:hypothetical protein
MAGMNSCNRDCLTLEARKCLWSLDWNKVCVLDHAFCPRRPMRTICGSSRDPGEQPTYWKVIRERKALESFLRASKCPFSKWHVFRFYWLHNKKAQLCHGLRTWTAWRIQWVSLMTVMLWAVCNQGKTMRTVKSYSRTLVRIQLGLGPRSFHYENTPPYPLCCAAPSSCLWKGVSGRSQGGQMGECVPLWIPAQGPVDSASAMGFLFLTGHNYTMASTGQVCWPVLWGMGWGRVRGPLGEAVTL